MDIWDSLRLTLRHWKFTVPVLFLGLLFAFVVYSSTPSTWKVNSTVILIGPTEVERVVDDEAEIIPQNGYFEAGNAMTLTRVLILAFTDPAMVGAIADEGLSVDFTMSWDNRQPLITTQITADSPEIATATAERLIELTAEELETRQLEAGAPAVEFATLDVLAVSSPKEDFASARLLGAVVFLLAVGATVGVAFAREWWTRRGEAPPEAARSLSGFSPPRSGGAVALDTVEHDADLDDLSDLDEVANVRTLPEQSRSAGSGSRWTR